MKKRLIIIFLLLVLNPGMTTSHGEHPKNGGEETDPKAFKILKEELTDPQTGLPRTLNPNLFKGKTKLAYQIAIEIPEVLAQIPCFCECESFGHENLLDCFIDQHGAG